MRVGGVRFAEERGKAVAQHAVKEYGQSELKDRESPESFREVGCPESFCSGTPAQLAVKEHGQRELKDREPPESFREVGCPDSFARGPLPSMPTRSTDTASCKSVLVRMS